MGGRERGGVTISTRRIGYNQRTTPTSSGMARDEAAATRLFTRLRGRLLAGSLFELFFVVAGAAFFVVTGEGGFDDRVGYGRRQDFVHFDDFSFELFVILKESADHG